MENKINKVKKYFQTGLFDIDTSRLKQPEKIFIKFLQIVVLTIKGYKTDRLTEQASALTYFTMLSIVPVLALGFGIAKGFGMEAVLEDEIAKNFAGQKEALNYILTFTRSMLSTAKGGVIAGIGLGVLLWSVLKLLMNIESSFNFIWDEKKSRSLVRKLTDYFAIMLLSPILMILSSSMTVYVSTMLSDITQSTEALSVVSPFMLSLAKLSPFVIVWILFTVLYLVMPNVKVNFKSALVAGIIAGTIFQLFQGVYISVQSSASRINAIYGSFAALPLFLIWLQISWSVVLLGCEISYVFQTLKMKGYNSDLSNLSIAYKKRIALLITRKIVKNFEQEKSAPSSEEIAKAIKVPKHIIELILEQLIEAKIISKSKKGKEFIFFPSKNTDKINIHSVLKAYENLGKDESKLLKTEDTKNILEKYDVLSKNKDLDSIVIKKL